MVYSGMWLEKVATFSWQQRLGIIERLSEIIFFSAGMYNVYFDNEVHMPTFNLSLVCTFTAFLMIHQGMFMDVTPKPEASWADKVLKVCRAIFFLLGSLLLVFMLIRMGYALMSNSIQATLD